MKKRLIIFVGGMMVVLILIGNISAPEILKGDTFIDQESKLTDREVFDEVLSGKFPINREHNQQLVNFLNNNPDKKREFLFTRGINYEEIETEITKIRDYEYDSQLRSYHRENIQLMLGSGKVIDLSILRKVTKDGISKPISVDIKMQETAFREGTFKVSLYDYDYDKESYNSIRNKNKITIKDSKIALEGNFRIEWNGENFKVLGKIEKSEQGKFSLSKGSEFVNFVVRDDKSIDLYSYRDFTKFIEVIMADDLEPKSENYLRIYKNGKIRIKGENIQTILNPFPPSILDEPISTPAERERLRLNPPQQYPEITSIMTPSGLLISQTPQESQTPQPYLLASETQLLTSRYSTSYPSLKLQQGNNQFTSGPTSSDSPYSSFCNTNTCRVNTHRESDTLPVHLRNQLLGKGVV